MQIVKFSDKMNSQSYFPNYYSIDDIFVTQERVKCKVNSKLIKMGFLDPGSETADLAQGTIVNLPLWYVKELDNRHSYFSVQIPDIYKNVYKAVCEAETTHMELGKLHPYFYEYGRYLSPYDLRHTLGTSIYEICRQRVRHLLDLAKNTSDDVHREQRFESLEKSLYDVGIRTNTLFSHWYRFKTPGLETSEMVLEHLKKRKRYALSDDEGASSQQVAKRSW